LALAMDVSLSRGPRPLPRRASARGYATARPPALAMISSAICAGTGS